MTHYSSTLLIYSADIFDYYIEHLKNNISGINVLVADNEKSFKDQIKNSNLVVLNARHQKLLEKEKIVSLLLVLENNVEYDQEDLTFVFDPFKNEDRNLKDYTACRNTLIQTLEFAIKKSKIPVTPPENVWPIVELN